MKALLYYLIWLGLTLFIYLIVLIISLIDCNTAKEYKTEILFWGKAAFGVYTAGNLFISFSLALICQSIIFLIIGLIILAGLLIILYISKLKEWKIIEL